VPDQIIMTIISQQLGAVRERLQAACVAAGRSPDSVALLAVTKTHGPDAVAHAVAAGQRAFGENYVQEGVDKIRALRASHPGVALEWHCIGPLQTNKTRLVAEHFDWVQTVDRLKIAQRLNEQRPDSMAALQVCIQVNVDGGHTKSGIALDEADALAEAVRGLPHLRLRGLMCIPDPVTGFDAQCAVFARAQAVFNRWQQRGWEVDTLSMGMSGDLEAAVASGATMVRVGSAIFGARSAA
jgi:PLP dependent protein